MDSKSPKISEDIGLEVLVKARQLVPDLILMDIAMPGGDGLEATLQIKQELPATVIVMLTVQDEEEKLLEAIKNGAQGYLLKSMSSRQILELLQGAMQDHAAINPALAGYMPAYFMCPLPVLAVLPVAWALAAVRWKELRPAARISANAAAAGIVVIGLWCGSLARLKTADVREVLLERAARACLGDQRRVQPFASFRQSRPSPAPTSSTLFPAGISLYISSSDKLSIFSGK